MAAALRLAAAESSSAAARAASTGTKEGRENARTMTALAERQRFMAEVMDHAFARVTVQIVLPAGGRHGRR